MPTQTAKPKSLLPAPPKRLSVGRWVEVLPEYRGTASFGELAVEEEPDARLYGRVREAGGGTVYVEVRAAANCSYGHFGDDRRPLAYTPGHAGLTADLPRKAVKLVEDPRTLGWLELIAGDSARSRSARESGADVAEDYYRGAQLMLKTRTSYGDGPEVAVQFSEDGARLSYADWDRRRYVDEWRSLPVADLEFEPETEDEVEFETWEFAPGAGEPELIDALRLLWELVRG